MRVVIATGNRGKVRELAALLADSRLEFLPQSEYNVEPVEETGDTFVANALLKARHAARATGLPAIADDSGLAVDALGGAPGVYSARYAGEGATDADNVARLLLALKEVPAPERGARFHCAMVYVTHADDAKPVICEGVWEGEILSAPRGSNGFGYDPVFFVPTHAASAAELDADTKNRLSHRGQALRALAQQLAGHTRR